MTAPKLIPCNGKMVTVRDLAECAGVNMNTVRSRLRNGWTPERIAATPAGAATDSLLHRHGKLAPSHHLYQGKMRSVREIANATGLSRASVQQRIRLGTALDTPGYLTPRTPRTLTYDGRTQSLTEWAKQTGLELSVLQHRLDRWGWSVERALTTPKAPRRPQVRRPNSLPENAHV